eukprot:m.138230 g.138230  ORF g.138230 m.138230 type:complete len:192 (+) comp13730_c0_seq1:324-899(+)
MSEPKEKKPKLVVDATATTTATTATSTPVTAPLTTLTYHLNVNDAVNGQEEDKNFHYLKSGPYYYLSGINTSNTDVATMFASLGISTIEDVANWEGALVAQAIAIGATVETTSIVSGSVMSINNALVSTFHGEDFSTLLTRSPTAILSLEDWGSELSDGLSVDTILDLANLVQVKRAQAISFLATEESVPI